MSKVIIDHASFARYRNEVDRALQRAVGHTAQAAAAAARQTQTEYDIQSVLNSIIATPVKPSRRGYAALVLVRDFKGMFFEKGTYAKRGAARSSRAKAVEGNRGVKPVRMLRKQVRPAKVMLEAQIRRALS